ncbi:hypothetical protein F8M41_016969 [Gigaspora margarita]|uniref:Uncharacterized protein n=1 Tax=Gigaspora margarita TaxID=4874 RepID=A0A8H4B2X0_GIGMA|nr:hypothetical protein F8M41_016969 [Gigaspora margarita]
MYIMNQENQLLLAKLYLEQSSIKSKGFKILTYLENLFIWTLEFLTPLFQHTGAQKATEINIDSTFKTNQERFELFVVNLNCGGYGMPIAYLYFTILNSTEEDLNNLEDTLTLYERELDNNNFITNFDTLIMPFLNEIDRCEEVLQTLYQQKTWTSNNKRLAFWLC